MPFKQLLFPFRKSGCFLFLQEKGATRIRIWAESTIFAASVSLKLFKKSNDN